MTVYIKGYYVRFCTIAFTAGLQHIYSENISNNENTQINHFLVFINMQPFSILLHVLRKKSSIKLQGVLLKHVNKDSILILLSFVQVRLFTFV